MNLLEMLLLIIIINIVYMTLVTLRMILVIKGYRIVASLMSVAEVFIYLMGLKIVLDNLDRPLNILAYCVGWGLGVYSGGLIESKLALGYMIFDVIVDREQQGLVSKLRDEGFGVTAWIGNGKDGERLCLKVIAKRKEERYFRDCITKIAPSAFVVSYEPNILNGGFFLKRKHLFL